jgi:hypothetical protein
VRGGRQRRADATGVQRRTSGHGWGVEHQTLDDPAGAASDVPVLRTIEEVVELVRRSPTDLYVRFGDPDDDLRCPSVDHESGITMPGVSVNPVSPPPWWQGRSLAAWIVRQICAYAHLREHDPQRACVLVSGTIADRGPDNEPLLNDASLVAVLAPEVVEEAQRRHRPSPRPEDQPTGEGAAPWQA